MPTHTHIHKCTKVRALVVFALAFMCMCVCVCVCVGMYAPAYYFAFWEHGIPESNPQNHTGLLSRLQPTCVATWCKLSIHEIIKA